MFHGEAFRFGKFQNNQMSSRNQYPVHFFQPLVQVFKIPYAECYGNGIEAIVGKAQAGAVFFGKRDLFVQSGCLHFSRPTFIIPSEISIPISAWGWRVRQAWMAKSPVPVATSIMRCGWNGFRQWMAFSANFCRCRARANGSGCRRKERCCRTFLLPVWLCFLRCYRA